MQKMGSLCRMTHLLFHLWQAALEIWLWVGSQEAVPVGRCSISLPESGQSQQHLRWVGRRRVDSWPPLLCQRAPQRLPSAAARCVLHIGAIQYTASLQQFTVILKPDGNASPLGAIVKSNGRSGFNQRHSVFLRHRHGTGVDAQLWLLGETCRRVCAQMGYASLDKCKSWQRADSKLHVPDGTQQKAQLHKSPLN